MIMNGDRTVYVYEAAINPKCVHKHSLWMTIGNGEKRCNPVMAS